jgi:hypothetical protein
MAQPPIGPPDVPVYPPPLTPPPLSPLGVQPDGSIVMGQSPNNVYAVKYDYGQPVNNDSAIPTAIPPFPSIEIDAAKLLAMPGAGNVTLVSLQEEWLNGETVHTAIFSVPWSIRIAWLCWCLGYETVIPAGPVLTPPGAAAAATGAVTTAQAAYNAAVAASIAANATAVNANSNLLLACGGSVDLANASLAASAAAITAGGNFNDAINAAADVAENDFGIQPAPALVIGQEAATAATGAQTAANARANARAAQAALQVANAQYAAVLAGPQPTFSRIPPMQHPEMPWLYATDARMVEAKGVPLNRDDLALTDPAGNLIPVPGVPAGILGAVGSPQGAFGTTAPGLPGYYAYAPWIRYAEPIADDDFQFQDGLVYYSVTYRHRIDRVLSDAQLQATGGNEFSRYVIKGKQYALKTYPIPAFGTAQLKFDTGPLLGTTIGQGIMVVQPLEQLEYTWRDVPWYSDVAIQSMVGRVNSVPFDGRPPETLLLQAPKITRKVNRIGRYTWDIVFRMDFNPFGWNSYLTNNGTTFYHASFPDGTTVYHLRDFNNLFLPFYSPYPGVPAQPFL